MPRQPSLRRILQHKPSKLTHFPGYFDEDSSSYHRQNTPGNAVHYQDPNASPKRVVQASECSQIADAITSPSRRGNNQAAVKKKPAKNVTVTLEQNRVRLWACCDCRSAPGTCIYVYVYTYIYIWWVYGTYSCICICMHENEIFMYIYKYGYNKYLVVWPLHYSVQYTVKPRNARTFRSRKSARLTVC